MSLQSDKYLLHFGFKTIKPFRCVCLITFPSFFCISRTRYSGLDFHADFHLPRYVRPSSRCTELTVVKFDVGIDGKETSLTEKSSVLKYKTPHFRFVLILYPKLNLFVRQVMQMIETNDRDWRSRLMIETDIETEDQVPQPEFVRETSDSNDWWSQRWFTTTGALASSECLK